MKTFCLGDFAFILVWNIDLEPSIAGAPSVHIPHNSFHCKPSVSKNVEIFSLTSLLFVVVSKEVQNQNLFLISYS